MKTDCYTVILQQNKEIKDIKSYETSLMAVEEAMRTLNDKFYEYAYSGEYIKEHTLTHKQIISLDDGYSIGIYKNEYISRW
jgi:hypothetical protein